MGGSHPLVMMNPGKIFFFRRLQDAADVFELEKASVDALTFFSVYSNFGRTWCYKIVDAINVRDG